MIIYKTINLVNGKWYVGQDSKNNPTYLGGGIALKKAIKKYGREKFKKYILEELPSNATKDDLNKAEIYWIKELGAVDDIKSYNIAEGGDSISTTDAVRQKISKALVGNKNGRANKKYTGKLNSQYGKRGRLHHLYGKPSPKKGRKASLEEVVKNAIAHGARFFEVHTKSGLYVGEWLIQTQCAKDLGLDNRSISNCLRGRRKTYKNYIFRYKNG